MQYKVITLPEHQKKNPTPPIFKFPIESTFKNLLFCCIPERLKNIVILHSLVLQIFFKQMYY